jgi:hypothetical protein
VAFARIGDTVYAVDGGTLTTVDLITGARTEWPSAGLAPADRYALLADAPARRLWLVAATDRRTTVDFLDPTSLAVTGHHDGRGVFMGAAALDGRLYLATSAGVEIVAQGPGRVPRAPAVRGQALAVAADPGRHRLVATVIGGRTIGIAAWVEGRRNASARAIAPIGKGNLAVAGGRIWAAGFGRHGVLARLDPGTLRVVRHSPAEREVGVGAYIVDSAEKHLLVRSGAGSQTDLWCIDAGTGAITRHWSPAAGTAVLTDHGVVLLAPGQPLIRLPAGGCRG